MSETQISETNKAITMRWFEEVWNHGDVGALREMLSPTAAISDLPLEQVESKSTADSFWTLVETFRSAFPDLRIDVEDMIAEGDKVTSRCRVRGTHRGDALGIPATNREVDFTGITIARIENGQLVEGWNSFDFLTMYQQLGLLTDPIAKK